MTSESTTDADLIKCRWYQQRRRQAVKTTAFLQLTAAGIVIPLAWASGIGYALLDAFGVFQPIGDTPEGVKLLRFTGAIVVSGISALLLKPLTHYLRKSMTPDLGEWQSESREQPPGTSNPKPKTRFILSAMASGFIGTSTTLFTIQKVITNEYLLMGASLSGVLFWLLLASCFMALYRESNTA